MTEETLQMRLAGKIRTVYNGRNLKGFVDICLNDTLTIRNIRIMEGKKGLFVSMPQHRGRDGKWYDTIYCPDRRIRSEISQFILSAYSKDFTSTGE